MLDQLSPSSLALKSALAGRLSPLRRALWARRMYAMFRWPHSACHTCAHRGSRKNLSGKMMEPETHTMCVGLRVAPTGRPAVHDSYVRAQCWSTCRLQFVRTKDFNKMRAVTVSRTPYLGGKTHKVCDQERFIDFQGKFAGHCEDPTGALPCGMPPGHSESHPGGPRQREAEAGPVESLGVSVHVRIRGGKKQGITISFDHSRARAFA